MTPRCSIARRPFQRSTGVGNTPLLLQADLGLICKLPPAPFLANFRIADHPLGIPGATLRDQGVYRRIGTSAARRSHGDMMKGLAEDGPWSRPLPRRRSHAQGP